MTIDLNHDNASSEAEFAQKTRSVSTEVSSSATQGIEMLFHDDTRELANETPQDTEEIVSKKEIAEGVSAKIFLRSKHPMEFLMKTGVTIAFLKPGDIVEGIVLEKKGSRLFVDLQAYGTGIVYGREYSAAHDVVRNLKSGDNVSAKVVETDNEEGYVELSLVEAAEERRWIDLKKMLEEGTPTELKVLEANSGGLILELRGIKGFLPTSQLSSKNYPRVEGGDKEKILNELQKLIGQPLRVKVLDIDPKEDKLIFTEKGLDADTLRSSLVKYKIGEEVEGVITGVVDFGAFVKFDEAGLEGLIHLSEIAWTLIENPREVLKAGDIVRAKIIDIQGDKISLSLKQLKEDPWLKIHEQYAKGDTVKGKITKLSSFGAFVQIHGDFHGLVRVTEFGSEAVMREKMTVGSEHQFKIIAIDPKEHRMSLACISEENPPELNK